METITGAANAKIKLAVSLRQKKYRDRHNLFVLEGLRNAETAQAAGCEARMCFCSEKMAENPRAAELIEKLSCPVYRVSDNIYAKLSDTDSPQGLMFVLEQTRTSLDDVPQKENLFALVLDRLQDPGNIGTIIRTADAMGVDCIICLNGTADIFSPKTVRSAMGSLFGMCICTKVSESELIKFFNERGLKLYASVLSESSKPVWEADYKNGCGVILGNEANGVSENLIEAADEQIYIPMRGRAESLNVAGACAMIIYERNRQNI